MYIELIFGELLMLLSGSMGKPTEVATFFKDASIYNSVKIPSIGKIDQIQLNFKTKQDFSYIFHIGAQSSNSENELQYMLVYLDNSQLAIRIKHDQIVNSTFKVACVSIYSSCADNHWHSMSISQKKNMIKIIVDRVLVLETFIGDILSQFLNQYIVFGSSISLITNDKGKYSDIPKYLKHYRGCFQKLIYTSDTIDILILNQAKSKRHFDTTGVIYFDKCSDLFPIEPISFHTETSFIIIKGWTWSLKGKLQFTFKTTETDALLVYQKSGNFQYNQFDFYAFEIRNSYLHFSINTGSGTISKRVSSLIVSDGERHYVKLWFEDGKIEVQLDAEKKLERKNNLYKTLDITGDIFLGGISDDLVSFFPHSIWSGILRRGFVGCLLEISFNGVQYDLALKAQKENISGISVGCTEKLSDKNFCENKPCMYGICSVGYNRFICDCSRTNYTGNTCANVAPLVKFNGFQYMIITMPHGFQSECEDITLRFLTTRPNGVLIITRSQVSGASDKIKVYIDNGQLAVLLNFGKRNRVIKSSINVFDGKWHSFKLKRRQLNLIFSVDDYEIRNNLNGTSKLLSNDIINLGRYKATKEEMYFTGSMMHFIFNGVNYFEIAKKESPPNIEVTATIYDADITKEFPITFQSTSSYLRLPRINMYGDFKLEFFLKTKANKGKILQLYGGSGDYLVLKIVSGFLNLIFNWGNGHNKKIHKEIRINDNKWHQVLLVRENSTSNAFAFRIDGIPKGSYANIPLTAGGINFNSFKDLYLGNANKYLMKSDRLQNKIMSEDGFDGCIASFYMNQTKLVLKQSIYQNLLLIASANNRVIEGCQEEFQYQVTCQSSTCQSNGRCIQQWTRIRCDCTMTSFSGDRCDRISKTLKFNDYPAYLIFKLSPSRNTTLDELAFGIQTSIITSTPIIKIEGEGRQPDFILVRLLKDKGRAIMAVEFNMGSGTSRLVEPAVNIADGFYHRMAFRRNGKIASLQVDDLPTKIYSPSGKTSIHFNQQRSIYIGKNYHSMVKRKRSISGKIYEYFSGYLSGLYFNRIHLGEMIENISNGRIILINRSNVDVEAKFIPNFKKQPQKPSILSEQEIVRDNEPNQKNNPIIMAKQNCSNVDPSQRFECKHIESRGLIRPNVSYKFNIISTSPKTIAPSTNGAITEQSISQIVTDFKDPKAGSINVWLIMGFSIGGSVLLVFITCFIYRCCRKDEGSYNVEEDRVFFDPTCKNLNINDVNKNDIELHNTSSLLTNSSFNSTKHKPLRRDKNSDTKEWYV